MVTSSSSSTASAAPPTIVAPPTPAVVADTTALDDFKFEEALNYIKEVKDEIGEGGVYDAFLETMEKLKAKEVDALCAIPTIKKLLEGHSTILLGFSTFLPEGYKMQIRDDSVADHAPTLPSTPTLTSTPHLITENKKDAFYVNVTNVSACGGWAGVRREMEAFVVGRSGLSLTVSDPSVRAMKGNEASGGLDLFAYDKNIRKITLPHIEEVRIYDG